jgi:[ribosomal protein S5]-alanine N-acetyltransferase
MDEIATERLYQRPWRLEDVDAVNATYAKPAVMRWIPGGAWDRARTERFVGRMIELHQTLGYCVYPVVLKDAGRIVGHCGLNHLEGGPEIEIAYLFDEPYWGRGYATEIARAVLGRAFESTSIERIVAVAFPENIRSIAVMERAGMRSAGVARHFNADVIKYEAVRAA